VGLAAFMAVARQPGMFQDPKMLRDGRLRDSGLSRQRSDRLLALATKTLEDRPPRRIGERSEEHVMSVWHWNS
jgi:hypothetical protein